MLTGWHKWGDKMKRIALIAVLCLLSTSALAKKPVMINGVLDYGKGCTVTVYQTEVDAEKGGEIVELFVIKGTSAPSFNHKVENAIRKHAKKACECDADKVYVQSSKPWEFIGDAAFVTMVAFKYADAEQSTRGDNGRCRFTDTADSTDVPQ
jgi:hypothetical protein